MKEWNMLIRLIKVQFPAVFDLPFLKKGKKKLLSNSISKVLLSAFTVFLLAVSFVYSYGIGKGLESIGRADMLIELAAGVASVAIFFTTVYKIRGIIFDFKDFDFLLSLPLKFTTVVTGRLLLLYLINLPAAVIIMIPAGISYSLITGWDIAALLINLAGMLLLPLFPVTLAAMAGVLIAFIASRFRSSKLINIIFIFTVLLIFMAVPYFGGMGTFESVSRIYPIAALYKRAVWGKKILSIVIYILISLGSFGIFAGVTGKRFIALNTALSKKTGSRKKKALKAQAGSPFLALYTKEVKRYFSSVNYVVNTGFGMVLLTVFSVASLFLPPDFLTKLLKVPNAAEVIKQFLPEFVAFSVAMTCISASSISLEGKNLWLMKSLPLSAGMIFRSKIAVNLVMTVPLVLIDSLLLDVGFGLDFMEFISIVAFGVSISFYTSISGLLFNLLLPKFDWSSEITVIKQSMAVLASIFTGFVAAMLRVAVKSILPAVTGFAALLIGTVLLAAITAILYLFLRKTGEKRFGAF
ncbi:hypothetical protein [Anaerocolumna xylanovorans]|uniref:ABC-2 type transport system permease protein n=1 Tax=Anaerocolumna xylanovorans DSM 12503 TaxID=1121345 RepID=A0A1M7YF84_9FIRM|nr:hypothetical protein [Anaerocolumna xylanovorans]SHO51246.1 ABC-2 type transport system permease protein [Anaerocolumna xylanovorans DSM 12503]